jgi:hypothetical protein
MRREGYSTTSSLGQGFNRDNEIVGHHEIFDRSSGRLVGFDEDVGIVEVSRPCTHSTHRVSDQGARPAWNETDEYQAPVGLRYGSATSNLVIVSRYPDEMRAIRAASNFLQTPFQACTLE